MLLDRSFPEMAHADIFNRPAFQMGPYDHSALALNHRLVDRAEHVPEIDWPHHVGPAATYTVTVNAREAIALAVEALELTAEDEILILTTSGSPYVSRCVTEPIERYCRWTRVVGPRTRALFLIHEFGFPVMIPPELVTAGLPVIEDCAYALGSQNAGRTVGQIGDYVVFSFSKALPMPFGGLLKSPRPPKRPSALSDDQTAYLAVLLDHHLPRLPVYARRRRRLYEMYRQRLAENGVRPLFTLRSGTVPHSFVAAVADQAHAEGMKLRLNAAGVISSVFYGGGGYFLPNQPSLTDAAVEYIVAAFLSALRGA